MTKIISSLPKKLCLSLIRFYHKYLSINKLQTCRFYPTCSAYAEESIEKYGALRGSLRSMARILRCHPFSRGGYDPA
ncbi:MAG: membrane protein insertion efficiency factor YidD [Candidatus Omnitrophica bacterium]|nr:membrane protein insertion efficiency factor YidD [Candidatus Omnitrophota bacterium]